MSPAHPWPFNRIFDVVVVGTGHAGFAATRILRQQGRSVLLIGARGDLVWESGRGFCPDMGSCPAEAWQALTGAVAQRGGTSPDWMDGAITEVVATDQLIASGAAVLYYAQPVAVDRTDHHRAMVTSLLVATRAGLRRVVGRRWIDATESGELLRLIDPAATPRQPSESRIHLVLQHADWASVPLDNRLALRSTAWPTERVMSLPVPHEEPAWREQVLAGLETLENVIGGQIANVSLSHLSIEPVPRYEGGAVSASTSARPRDTTNVVSASPAFSTTPVTTLADRFTLGVEAATRLAEHDAPDISPRVFDQPLASIAPVDTLRTDVCVAGAGTGGPLAAIAAAQAGAKVICIEPMAFAGGIGGGGGIHSYLWGVAGGLQQQVDQRTRQLMDRFHGGPLGDGPFNPWAKMIALEQLLREHGVQLHTGAMLFDLEKRDDRVTAIHVATPRGVRRIEAQAFIDGTGDGDLCALAGAAFSLGRECDGLIHAFTQSSGKLRDLNGRPRMQRVNFDAGYCDPTDPQDFTRARLEGIRQYLSEKYDNLQSRPTYIAPAIGLRQGRQVVTEYVLSLDDQLQRRRFTDTIGYAGSHFDTHSTDFEFESDEALFWAWANRGRSFLFAYELSYRMLVPKGLANVWIASRCLGLSQDAHYSCRMQRDVQRAGEAAGFAAAEAVRRNVTALQLPYATLRHWLDRTGALAKRPRHLTPLFNPDMDAERLETPNVQRSAELALAALDRAEPGDAIWWLYRHEPYVRDAVRQRLNSDKPMVSWLAACVLAMWHDPAAEPRLLHALASREYGYGEDFESPTGIQRRPGGAPMNPMNCNRMAPNWLCAVAMLRRCGTQACLPALEQLLDRPVHAINTLTSVALTLERLVKRGVVEADGRLQIEAMLGRLLEIRHVGAHDHAQRSTGRYAEEAIRGVFDASMPDDLAGPPASAFGPQHGLHAFDDNTWQLHFAVARARVALGLPLHDAIHRYLSDPRAVVRRAMAALTPRAVEVTV